jgi:hypothetical protein
MANEIRGTQQASVAIYPQAGTGPLGPVAQVTSVTRVLPGAVSGAWTTVWLLNGSAAGQSGWAPTASISPTGGLANVADDTEMRQLFLALRLLNFTPPGGSPTQVPYRYPKDGCFARAEVMAKFLKTTGYTADKEWVICKGGLRATTAHGGDQPDFGRTLQVDWWYHVAPILYADYAKSAGKPSAMVLDPSTADGPLSPAQWAASVSPQPVGPEMKYADMRDMLRGVPQYPVLVTWLVRSGAPVYALPVPSNVDATVTAVPDSAEKFLAMTAALVPAHDVVAGLDALFRRCLAALTDQNRDQPPPPYPGYPNDITVAAASIKSLTPQLRSYIVQSFPVFRADWYYTFSGTGLGADITHLLGLLTS